jgi:hypothetical protein
MPNQSVSFITEVAMPNQSVSFITEVAMPNQFTASLYGRAAHTTFLIRSSSAIYGRFMSKKSV